MPEGTSTHQDLITIVIEGKQAEITLQELRALFVSLQEAAVATGVQVDQAMGRLVTPLRAIAENTGMAVRELQALRLALTGVGGAAAGPAQAAAGLRQLAQAARDANAGLMGMPAYGFRPTGQLVSGIAPAGMEQPGVPVTMYGRYGGEAIPSSQDVQRVEELAASFDRAAEAQGKFAMSQEQLAVAADPQIIAQRMREQIALAQAMGDPTAVRRATQDYKDFVYTTAKLGQEVGEADRAVGRFSGSFRRHIVWFAQGTVIYYALFSAIQAVSGQIQGIVEDILAYDTTMAQMRFITGETTAGLTELTGAALSVGAAFGQMPTDIYPGLVQITQATKDFNEQLQLTTDAAKWAFMSGQEFSDGLDQLVAIERVWNLEASEGQRILDAVAVSYRVAMVPMDEMMAALERGGKIAESVGMSFEEYAAMIAAMGEYANLSESQLTSLMEAMARRPFQPGISTRFQQEFGFLDIPIFEPGTALTQRREIVAIVDDLTRVWDRLSASQRQSVAEMMAGGRYAAEFLAFMEAWKHVPDYVDEYNDSLGESNRLLDQEMQTLPAYRDRAVAAFRDIRHETGQWIFQLLGVPDILDNIASRLEAQARLARVARGEPAEPPTRSEQLRADIAEYEEELARLRGQRGYLEQVQARLRHPFEAGITIGEQEPRFFAVMEEQIAIWREELASLTPPSEYGRPGDLMAEYRAALAETVPVQAELISEEQVFLDLLTQVQETGMMPVGIDEWAAGLDAVSGALDLTEYSHQQINQAQLASIALANTLFQIYLDQATALKGSELTTLQIKAIAEATLFNWAETSLVIQDAAGQYRIISGLAAAFLQDTIRQYEAERARFDIRRLGEVQPERFGEMQQMAWQWQAYLQQIPGYDEEVQQFWVILADNVARPIVTTATALRYAIEDLTEVEKQQLEGMWNLPAGAVAYVPITSLFYARQQEAAAGPPGAVPMAGPPTGITGAGVAPSAPQIGTAVADANIARFTPLTREMMTEIERIFTQPWDLQQALAALAEWQAGTYAPEPLYTPVTPEMFTEMDLVFAQMQSLFETYRSAFEPGLAIIRSITGEGAWPGVTGRAEAALEQPPQRFQEWLGERPTDPLGLAGILGAAISPLIRALLGLSGEMAQSRLAPEKVFAPMEPKRPLERDTMAVQPWDFQQIIGVVQTGVEAIRPQQISVNIPPVMADISMTSNLYLDGAIIARLVQREVGRRLSHASRGYGMTGGGNAPRMMI